jgi:glycosyltransferase involved in cell wall biosynthesis
MIERTRSATLARDLVGCEAEVHDGAVAGSFRDHIEHVALTSVAPPPVGEASPPRTSHGRVAIAHDYLATIGGAERVFLSIARALPDAPIYTSLYEPSLVTPAFHELDVRPSVLNRLRFVRRNYRVALPALPLAMRQLNVDADVVVCSSSGWSHGVHSNARKVVYCHNPARWLYQREEYLRGGRRSWWVASTVMHPFLLAWDRRAAKSCARYLANSSIVARRIRDIYGVEAEILPPPVTFRADGPQRAITALRSGFFLVVSRLIEHKNIAAVIDAMRRLPNEQLVIVGEGPAARALDEQAPPNVRFLGRVEDDELHWLYANCRALVSASREDFGLTPVEAGMFGKPSALLRFGGFLDTMVEGDTAVFFDEPDGVQIAAAVRTLLSHSWDSDAIVANANRYSEDRFAQRLRDVVAEELDA